MVLNYNLGNDVTKWTNLQRGGSGGEGGHWCNFWFVCVMKRGGVISVPFALKIEALS